MVAAIFRAQTETRQRVYIADERIHSIVFSCIVAWIGTEGSFVESECGKLFGFGNFLFSKLLSEML